MHYMITIPAKGFVAQMPSDAVDAFKTKMQDSITNGRVVGAYSKVGGGLVIITDVDTHGEVAAELRKHQIMDATVEPLVDFIQVLDAYVESRATGAVGMELAMADEAAR